MYRKKIDLNPILLRIYITIMCGRNQLPQGPKSVTLDLDKKSSLIPYSLQINYIVKVLQFSGLLKRSVANMVLLEISFGLKLIESSIWKYSTYIYLN